VLGHFNLEGLTGNNSKDKTLEAKDIHMYWIPRLEKTQPQQKFTWCIWY